MLLLIPILNFARVQFSIYLYIYFQISFWSPSLYILILAFNLFYTSILFYSISCYFLYFNLFYIILFYIIYTILSNSIFIVFYVILFITLFIQPLVLSLSLFAIYCIINPISISIITFNSTYILINNFIYFHSYISLQPSIYLFLHPCS